MFASSFQNYWNCIINNNFGFDVETKKARAFNFGCFGWWGINFFYIIDLIEQAFGLFDYIMEITHLDSKLFALLIKIVGIGYLTEFSAGMCEDAGSSSMASKIMLAGKLVIFVMAIPIITTLLEIIVGLMP